MRITLEPLELRLVLSGSTFLPSIIDCCAVNSPHTIVTHDFDGDGWNDVVAANDRGFVSHRNAQGEFKSTYFDARSNSIHVIDVDSDGSDDLLIGSHSGSSTIVTWFPFVASREHFGTPRFLLELEGRVRLFTGDAGNDEDIDLLFSDEDGIHLLENEGGLIDIPQPSVVTPCSDATQVELLDIDNDDINELVAVCRVNDAYQLGFVNGKTFADKEVTIVGDGFSFVAADLDRDGDADLVAFGSGKGTVYSNVGGQLKQGQVFPSGSRHAVADIDNDGDQDIISQNSHLLSVIKNDGGLLLEPRSLDAAGPFTKAAIAASDLNRDGHVDLIAGEHNRMVWLPNAGTGDFADAHNLVIETAPRIPPIAADMDSDGDMDLLVGSVDGSIAWGESSADHEFIFHDVGLGRETYTPISAIAAADIDGDGDQDVVFGHAGSDRRIGWFENTDGEGDFSHHSTDVGKGVILPNKIIPVDFDVDGDLDILVSTRLGIVHIYENRTGDGLEFGSSVINTGAGVDMAVSDINVDGRPDLVVASDSEVSWFQNTGQGFSPASEIVAKIEGIHRIVVVNVDSDIGEEFVVGADSGLVVVDDDFSLIRTSRTSLPDEVLNIDAADVDGDGDVDVVTSSYTANRYDNGSINWHENIGSKEFADARLVTDSIQSPTGVAVVDFNGDGNADIAVAASGYARISLLTQRTVGDVNNDGIFNSSDLVLVFQRAEYEDSIVGNSTFEDGDWNNDGEFDSSDFVFAFQAGTYRRNAALPRVTSLHNVIARIGNSEKSSDESIAQSFDLQRQTALFRESIPRI